jgi:hypothetical protein
MSIAPVSHSPAAAALLTTQSVSAAVLKRATSDGDGKTGAAALNDGDAASQAAQQAAKASQGVSIKA